MECIVLTLKVLTVTFGVYVKSNDQYSVIKVFFHQLMHNWIVLKTILNLY